MKRHAAPRRPSDMMWQTSIPRLGLPVKVLLTRKGTS